MIGHRRQREHQILRLLDPGATTIAAIVPQMYAGINPALFGAAGRSVLAHLIDLERRGRVRREVDQGDLWMRAS